MTKKELKQITKEVAQAYSKHLEMESKQKKKQVKIEYEIKSGNLILDNTLCDTLEEALQLKKDLSKYYEDLEIVEWKTEV